MTMLRLRTLTPPFVGPLPGKRNRTPFSRLGRACVPCSWEFDVKQPARMASLDFIRGSLCPFAFRGDLPFTLYDT